MKIYTTAAADYSSVLFVNGGSTIPGSTGPEEGSKVVNEDGSGDGILFENGDQMVTE